MTLAAATTFARRALPVLVAGILLVSGGMALAQNDACSNPSAIPADGPFPYSMTVNTAGYADDAGDPIFSCKGGKAGPVGKTAWFTFTPSVTDNYRIDTAGTTSASPSEPYDTILLVNTGTCASLSPLANGCADDTQAGSLHAALSLALQAGTTYTFVIGGIGEIDFLTGQTKPTKGGNLKVTVSRVAIDYPYRYYLPSVARAQGVTLYVSDVNVTNQEGADGQFTMQFLGHGNDGDQNPPASQPSLPNPVSIGAFGTRQFNDVVGSTSGFNLGSDYGAILVQSTRKLLIGARTYTSASTGGTFGQFAPGVDASTESLTPGEVGRLIGVRDDNTPGAGGFRTNVVLVNTSNPTRYCPTQLEAHDGNGTLVGTATVGVAPGTMVQKTFRQLFSTAPALPNGAIRVILPSSSTGCSIGAVAYVIDNSSQDPFAVALHK